MPTNPVLPGFHPDPSIVRVGEWYYIANSTFEWWPGVRLHRSRDLANWELVGHALTRKSQLDLRGCPDSGGVWAPGLSHDGEKFWLVYSDVKSLNGSFKDVRNYVVTAEAIDGPWSDPVYLNSSGFDPSLFHDVDGRKWLLNQHWDPRPGRSAFAGILLQEYSAAVQNLVGAPRTIFRGSSLGITEGPHLLRRDGFYYLVTAEGGTGWAHAVTVARSREIAGPYELSPHHPLLTARSDPHHALQKTGHASFVESPDGRWFAAYLCSRPVGGSRRCMLGRETAIQPLHWPSGEWPRLANGIRPEVEFEVSEARASRARAEFRDDFVAPTLNPEWSTLREPADSTWLDVRDGLRIAGRHSLQSRFDQSLIAIRLSHHCCDVSVELRFEPRSFLQTAGLAFYYDTENFVYACVSADDGGAKIIRVLEMCGNVPREVATPSRVGHEGEPVLLFARLRDGVLDLEFGCGAEQRLLAAGIDATFLSDDFVIEQGRWGFTGCMIALCAQDAGGNGLPANFRSFHYRAA